MSNDTVIFLDTDTSQDGMLFLEGNGNDDDFLGGLWLAKKEKKTTQPISSNELDDTAISTKTESTEEAVLETSTSENEQIIWSLDALVVKKAERKASTSWEGRGRTQWREERYSKKSDYKSSENWKSRFSIADANKMTFEQGKTSKKRVEKPARTPLTGLSNRAPEEPPHKNSSRDHSQSSQWWATREDRRKNATWQAVVFNRGGGGQKVTGGSGSKTQNKKSPLSSNDYKVSQTISRKEEITIGDSVTVKEFAEKMGVPIAEVIKKFIANKMLLSLNSSIDFEVATLIAMEFDIKVSKESASAEMQDLLEWNLQAILEVDRASDTKEERPPIVTIMGHVDHGKTTLLDYLRKTWVANKEHGGITQSIGWSQIVHNGKKVTFIDTPGHALFTSLRARGSKITDIVVIVVAADDGIMKQTVEAINHAKDAKVPIIVAITKIDKWVDNSEFIKTQLSEHGLVAEDRWGDVPIVKISSLTGQWIDDLMDQILLHAEVSELICNPNRNGIGVVLEAHKDIQRWVIANMIMMTGTIRVWDVLWIYNTFGKVKKIYNRKGHEIKSAVGWDPIMILGINDVPEAGKLVEAVSDEKTAKAKIAAVEHIHTPTLVNAIVNKIAEWATTQVNLLIKADSWWSLEALKAAIAQIELPENVSFKIVHSDIGNFFDADLDLAKASDALLIWFGNGISTKLKTKIDQMGITLKAFNIIYEITDYLSALAKGLIKRDPVEVAIGKLTVLWVFFRKWNETIFGGKVTEGEIRNGSFFRIIRWDEVFDTGKITSLQKGQENVDKISSGYECGMKAKISKKIEVGDTLEYYVME